MKRSRQNQIIWVAAISSLLLVAGCGDGHGANLRATVFASSVPNPVTAVTDGQGRPLVRQCRSER
jgi:hypothetical protein